MAGQLVFGRGAVTKVLYIAGAGRSGSTLLASVLGQGEGIVDVGELWKHWRKLADGGQQPCGCGQALGDCPFWIAVQRARPGVFDATPELLSAARRIGHARGSLRLRAELALGRSGTDIFANAYEEAYAAVAQAAGARVIIDSSKMPGPGFLVERMKSVEVYLLHFTRDPRAVAASWLVRKGGSDGAQALETRKPAAVAKAWTARALATELLLRPGVPRAHYRRIAYEDFAAKPQLVVSQILEWVGEPSSGSAFTGERRVHLEVTHSSGGNPGRLSHGEQEILPDERWKSSLLKGDRRKVERLTFPLRRIYDYR